jgi:hypothetical protein
MGSMMSEEWKSRLLEILADRRLDDQGREAAFLLKTEHLPRKLFKYRVVDEHTEELLNSGILWLANPETFNDPFDSASTFSFREIEENIRKGPRSAKESLLVKLTRGDTLGLPDWLRGPLVEQMQGWGRALSVKVTHSLTKRLRQDLGVTCFSETPTSVPMWAHYANQHSGFCCEWDLAQWPEDVLRRRLFPVVYAAETLRKPPLLTNPHYPGAPLLMAIIKAPEWSYEQEWRYVEWGQRIGRGRPVQLIPPTRVHLGLKVSSEHANRIRSLCATTGIEVRHVGKDVERSRLQVDD